MKQQKSFQETTVGKLYLVPTPIGNLDDMTFRAVKILNDVDIILAEDTRHTQKLLNHFHINTSQISFHEHNSRTKIPQVIDWLLEGKQIAQVSDAGTPSISDPGQELVYACVEQDISIVSLPGANAAITALIASGVMTQPFYFHGFLLRKKSEQLKELIELAHKKETMIFYESPFRLAKTLQNMCSIFSTERQVVVCRELTKQYEEYTRGTLKHLSDWAQQATIKGEICLIVSGVLSNEIHENTLVFPKDLSIQKQVDWVCEHLALTNKEAIKYVAKQLNVSKQSVYKNYHQKN